MSRLTGGRRNETAPLRSPRPDGTRFARLAAMLLPNRVILLLLTAVVGCGYQWTFRCEPDGPDCPKGQACPTLPLGSGGCEDFGPMLDHDAIKVDAGRPPGCLAGLPYGNPFWDNAQVTCICVSFNDPEPGAAWSCPL